MIRKEIKDKILRHTDDYIRAVHAYMICPTKPQKDTLVTIEEEIDRLRVLLRKTVDVPLSHATDQTRPKGSFLQ